jgi:hypothetical protein
MKVWRPIIEQHIHNWSTRLGNLGWWPKYVYHFTDVTNAASIIEQGGLYSRAYCLRTNLMATDNASHEVIQKTKQDHLEYVRLYFRPRTPTQYNNEGLRPINQRKLGSHCPVPIFFCFNALEVLSLDETEFSNGNMGSSVAQHSKEQEFFESIPFELVFHSRWFTPDERDTIIFHRSAEVLVPHHLPLDSSLKFIACRSAAERQTLLHLLPSALRQEWSQHIRIGDQGLFERRWTFVEEVVVVDNNTIVFKFNPSTTTPGPFNVKFVYQEDGTLFKREWTGSIPSLSKTLQIRVSPASSGVASLYLDDALAFRDTLLFDDLPF